ncbi:MAG: hypothetical protein ACP5HM_06385 [Anaerolineae bacterium]
MKASLGFLLIIGAILVASLGGCGADTLSFEETDQGSTGEVDAPAPTAVVDAFYTWYLGYPGNPWIDAAYRDRPELHPDAIADADALMSERQLGMGDPFLCAQARPGRVETQLVESDTHAARVEVTTDFEGHRFYVTLARDESHGWQITEIACETP